MMIIARLILIVGVGVGVVVKLISLTSNWGNEFGVKSWPLFASVSVSVGLIEGVGIVVNEGERVLIGFVVGKNFYFPDL